MTVATVIIPTHDHGPTLVPAVESVLGQRVQDLEVFVVGDGVPENARQICRQLADLDQRVRFFDNPKGPRNGEVHRHEALKEAGGRIVCYLSDDDLWLPDHVAFLLELLEEYDFAHSLPIRVSPGGDIDVYRMDLSHPWYRRFALDDRGIRKAWVPLSCGAHTLDLYRRLPVGWSTTPGRLPTDRYMWHKISQLDGVRMVSGTRPTVVHLASTERRGWTLDQRVAELRAWGARLQDEGGRNDFRMAVLDSLARRDAAIDARLPRRLAEAVMRRTRLHPLVRSMRDRP